MFEQLLSAESFSSALRPSPIMALGDWAFYLSTASSHLPWKSRLFPPYASMFCQASLVCSALSKFHYGMAGSTLCCSLRLSAWHVTVCNTGNAGGLNTPSTEDCLTTFAIAWLWFRIKDLGTHGCMNPTGMLKFKKGVLGKHIITEGNQKQNQKWPKGNNCHAMD